MRHSNAVKEKWTDRWFMIACYSFITLLGIICLYPCLNLVAKSFSSDEAIYAGKVLGIWPIGFTGKSYNYILESKRFWITFGNTVFITVIGTALNLAFTVFVSYAVSRKDMFGSKAIMIAYIFTMIFNAGMIPTYLAVSQIGLIDSLTSLIVPNIVAAYNVILMRNYIDSLPEELIEAADIDGANQMQILFRIILPLMLPSLATIGLFCCVSYWNTYFNALLYINSKNKATLQIYLKEILISTQGANMDAGLDELADMATTESVQAACVVATALPIIIVYPLLQKYYVQGMTVGAVKG